MVKRSCFLLKKNNSPLRSSITMKFAFVFCWLCPFPCQPDALSLSPRMRPVSDGQISALDRDPLPIVFRAVSLWLWRIFNGQNLHWGENLHCQCVSVRIINFFSPPSFKTCLVPLFCSLKCLFPFILSHLSLVQPASIAQSSQSTNCFWLELRFCIVSSVICGHHV